MAAEDMDANAGTSAPEHETRARQMEADARKTFRGVVESVRLIWESFRFVLFFFYAVFAVVAFWLWAFTGLVLLLRGLVRLLMGAVLWLSQGAPPGSAGRFRTMGDALAEAVRGRWERRHIWYSDLARPFARVLYDIHHAAVRFWNFSFPRKLLVLVMGFFFVFVPGMYVVPRPHYVQVIDDNAVNYYDDGQTVVYLIHGRDLFEAGQTREYENENAPWLLKFNAQGMKNQLTVGRFYKFWVVGLRWYIPQLYPNIIAVTETDRYGVPLAEPTHIVPVAPAGPG